MTVEFVCVSSVHVSYMSANDFNEQNPSRNPEIRILISKSKFLNRKHP